jgi:alkylhydroperoxidase family enzyme
VTASLVDSSSLQQPIEDLGRRPRHYDETALADLVTAISATNVWNRLNVTTRQVVGEAW